MCQGIVCELRTSSVRRFANFSCLSFARTISFFCKFALRLFTVSSLLESLNTNFAILLHSCMRSPTTSPHNVCNVIHGFFASRDPGPIQQGQPLRGGRVMHARRMRRTRTQHVHSPLSTRRRRRLRRFRNYWDLLRGACRKRRAGKKIPAIVNDNCPPAWPGSSAAVFPFD